MNATAAKPLFLLTNDIKSGRSIAIDRPGRVFEIVNYWRVLLAHGPLPY
ncbi:MULTISPECIES: hypothetical protein [unclassified Microcoleus]